MRSRSLTAGCLLILTLIAVRAASAQSVRFDANDNPIPDAPSLPAPRILDPLPFDANDNPIRPSAPHSSASVKPIAGVIAPRVAPAEPRVPLAVALPQLAGPTRVPMTVLPSINPLKATASTLCRVGDRIFLGLRDGGIAFCDRRDGKNGYSVRFVQPVGPVRALAAVHCARGGSEIWWLNADGSQLTHYREADRTAKAFPIAATALSASVEVTDLARSLPPSGWAQRVVVLDGAVFLSGDGLTRILDPATGVLRAPTAADLPLDTAAPLDRSSVYLAIDPDDAGAPATLAILPQDYSRTAARPQFFRSGRAERNGRTWVHLDTELGVAPAAADYASSATLTAYAPRSSRQPAAAGHGWRLSASGVPAIGPIAHAFDIAAAGCAFVDSAGLHLIPADRDGAPAIRDVAFDPQPGMPTALDRLSVGASGVWWEMRGILFHSGPDGARSEAYLPWNSAKGTHILCVLPDEDGVFVALDHGGVRHLVPDRPSDSDGYAGFVRVRLGDDTIAPAPGPEATIAASIEDWQGVPYKWGGQTKSGTDCSGFVGAMHKAAGITIPRSTSEMASSSQGKRVVDELHYGDVLVYPGHCALYIGNGQTAETVSAAVGKASIWRRTDVQIRRYLP